MRKLLLFVVLVALFAVGGAAQASAAPADVHVNIGPKAPLTGNFFISVPVAVTCPPTFRGFVNVSVSEAPLGGTSVGNTGVVCTGRAVTQSVTTFLQTGPLVLGRAQVEATVFEFPENGIGDLTVAGDASRQVSVVI